MAQERSGEPLATTLAQLGLAPATYYRWRQRATAFSAPRRTGTHATSRALRARLPCLAWSEPA
jgi:hypothetical protein